VSGEALVQPLYLAIKFGGLFDGSRTNRKRPRRPLRETKTAEPGLQRKAVRCSGLYSLFMNFLLDLYGFSDVMVV
jgi:hypothetical protein